MINDLKAYPAMKDSGVPWLGEVPEHWDVSPAFAVYKSRQVKNTGLIESTVLSLSYGRIIVKAPEKLRGLVPESFETYQIIKPGNIIVRTTDLQNDQTSLRIGHSHHRGIITSAYMCLETRPIVLNEFGYQYLNAYDLLKIIYGFGSGLRQSLDFSDIKRMPVLVPPRDEQAAIVRFLNHAGRKIRRYIRAKQKLIKLLEEQKQAIIHGAVTRGLAPSAPLKPSGIPWIGEIPEHWKVVRMKDVCRIQGGFAFKAEWFKAQGIPVIRMSNLRRGNLDISEAARVGAERCLSDYQLDEGDILYGLSGSIGSTGSLGNFAVVRQSDLPAQLNQRVARFRPDNSTVARDFLILLLQTSVFYEQVLYDTTGTAQFNVSTNDVGRVAFAVPSLTEQVLIANSVAEGMSPLNITISRLEREIALLYEYRTRLIADVVTGKLDVREAAAGLLEEEPVADESLSEPYDPDDAEDSLEDESFPSEEQ